jgi:hypothetical protein
MAYELNASNLLNPMMAWSDLGLRALDMTVASTQNITESVDRLTRAGAGAEPADGAASSFAVQRQADLAIPSAVTLSADLQRSTFDLILQGWLQWMNTMGGFASMAVDMASSGSRNRRSDPLDAFAKSLLPFAGAGTAARLASPSRRQGGRHESHSMEHAFAAADPKGRRGSGRTKSRTRRSRSA